MFKYSYRTACLGELTISYKELESLLRCNPATSNDTRIYRSRIREVLAVARTTPGDWVYFNGIEFVARRLK